MGGSRWVVVVALLLAWMLHAPRAMAAPAAVVDASTSHLELAPHLDVLEDPTAALGIGDVERPDVAARFAPFHGVLGPNLGFTRSALWARFAVENDTDAPLERWIVVDAPVVSHVEVFRDGEAPATQGVLEPRARRELPRRTCTFRLRLPPHATRVVHVRAWGESEASLPLALWDLGALVAYDRAYDSLLAVCYGVLLTMALYNAFLFFFVRDRTHLYYAAAMAFCAAWLRCIDGGLLDLLPDRIQIVPHAVNVVAAGGYLLFATLFVRRFLELRAMWPRLDRALVVGGGLVLLFFALFLVGAIDYRTSNLVTQPASLFMSGGFVVAGVLRMRRGFVPARYFVAGWSALLGVTTMVVLTVQGIVSLPIGLVPPHPGFAIEAILLSLGLADATRRRNDRIAVLHREAMQLNDELRHQVAERSRELTAALARSEGYLAPAAIAPGDVFDGRYRVVRQLGRGGMGSVYEVLRTSDQRRLALKVLTAELSGRSAARFTREAEIGARLRHENLAAIVDVGLSASTPFLVMELVEGGSMEARRDRFGDPAWALPVLRGIASGLALLHASGIVHRDLKPGNVLLAAGDGPGGVVPKISDFGISRAGSTHEGASDDLTATGALLGTPLYMAPEALRGPAREPSADVFSFGVLAYEALTGRMPFARPAVLAVRAGEALAMPPSIAGVPSGLSRVLLACLRVEPSDRPSAEQLEAALRAV